VQHRRLPGHLLPSFNCAAELPWLAGDDKEEREEMICPECERLLAEYESLGRSYTVAIHELTTRAGTSSREDYSVMRIAVEDARLAWEVSRMELLKHQGIHQSAN